ncbi:MAG: hypothetical protein K8I00_07730, partial [Candidatus Omnitrophica bacterium]|nr:hypothetical protein [Candidatus Omnitrophota bacterium]
AVAMGFLGAARLQNLALMAVPMAALLWTASPREKIRNFLTYGVTAGLAMTLFYLPYLTGGSRAAYLAQLMSYKEASVIPHVSLGLLFKPFLNILYHLIHTFSPLGILLIVIGCWLLLKSERRGAGIFLLLWLICPLLLYSRLYTLVPRFLTIMHPPLCIFLAYFCAANYHGGRIYRWLIITLAGVMSIGMYCMVFPVLQARHQRAYIPEYVQWIARQVPANSLVISTDDSYFFRYYSNLKMLSRFHNQYVVDYEEIADFRRRLDEALLQKVPVYVTEHGLRNYDPNSRFANLLTQEYRLELQGSQLYEYWQESCWQPARVRVPFYRIWPKSDES